MKKLLLLIFLTMFFVSPAFAQWGAESVYTKDQVIKIITEFLNQPKEKKSEVFRCPGSKISNQDMCFNCHIIPTMDLKEFNPVKKYDLLNEDRNQTSILNDLSIITNISKRSMEDIA